jgi:hypothetical protein
MKLFFQRHLITILGVVVGSIAGYFYWKYIGCTNGTCYIQSNPVRMTLYGALMGGLLFSIFQPAAKKN